MMAVWKIMRCGANGYYFEVIKDNPSHYWRLADDGPSVAIDEIGTADGYSVGGPTFGVSGAIAGNTAVGFSVGNYIQRGRASTAIDNFTLEFICKPSALSGVQMLCYNGDAATDGWGVFLDGNKIMALIGGLVQQEAFTFPDTNFHHIALVRDSGTLYLDLDGVRSSSLTATTPNSPSDYFLFGSYLASAFPFTGVLDEVATYQTALSPTRIAAHYAAIGL